MTISRSNFFVMEQLMSCRLVSTTNLNARYSNGPTSSGVGATLTNAGAAAVLTIDGKAVNLNDRILINGQTAKLQNGIYIVINIGDAVSTAWILQRSDDFQTVEQMCAGQYLTIEDGTDYKGALYVLVDPLPGSIGVNDIEFKSSTANGTLGTAAFKDASNNAVGDVASILPGSSTLNHFAVFADANRTLEDVGYTMTDPGVPDVASVIAPTVVGNLTVFSDIAGTIEDSSVAVSDPNLPHVSSVNSPVVIGNVPVFLDANGTLTDSGIPEGDLQFKTNIHATRTIDIGGAGAGPITVAHTGTTALSIVLATINTSSNTVEVSKATPGVDQIDFLFSGDPGASCLVNYVVFVTAQ